MSDSVRDDKDPKKKAPSGPEEDGSDAPEATTASTGALGNVGADELPEVEDAESVEAAEAVEDAEADRSIVVERPKALKPLTVTKLGDLEPEVDPESLPEFEPVLLDVADDGADGDGDGALEQAPLAMDMDTRNMLKQLKKEHKRQIQRELAEAKALEQEAKQKRKQIKSEQRFRMDYAEHMSFLREIAPQLGLDPDRPVTEIPELPDHLAEVEFQTIEEGRSYVRIVYDTEENRHLYQVIEPRLSVSEQEILEFLRDTLVRTVDGNRGADDWDEYLIDAIERAIVDYSILVDEVSKERLQYYLVRDLLGYGPIDVMMKDPMLEDISCDGPGIPVFLFHRQHESIRTNVVFEDEDELDSFVIRLAQRSGKHISKAEPLLDATLPDTSRLQATLSREVTARGPSFTIRKFRADPLTPPDLVRLGTMDPHLAAYYWLAMEQGSSLIYGGGTASGKTTTLNAVSIFIPPERKIVSIEDTREINLPHDNWIASVTRSGFGGEIVGGKMAGEIDMYELLEAALRQRPEYLIVGEVRGPEAQTLFQAMATGHATYSTLHADSAKSAMYRLENAPINVPRPMLQSLDAISIQTQARVDGKMVRRIREVTEVVGIDPETDRIVTHPIFEWLGGEDRYEFLGDSYLFEKIRTKNNWSKEAMEEEWHNRAFVVEWMVKKGIRHIDDVADVISAYYRGKEDVVHRARDSLKVEAGAEATAAAGAGDDTGEGEVVVA